MSDAPGPSKMSPRSGESDPAGLASEVAARLRSDIISGFGGQDAGPAPRARKSASSWSSARRESVAVTPPLPMQPMESVYRQLADEKVNLRHADKVKEVSIREALARAHVKTALAGNARALADITRNGMSKRVLLKTLHAGWRAMGRHTKRGTLPPTFEVAKQQLKTAQGFNAAIASGELDVEKLASGIIDEDARDVLERIGMLKSEAEG